MLSTRTYALYRDYRRQGNCAKNALHSARITTRFERLEALGLVRLRWEPDADPSSAWDVVAGYGVDTTRWVPKLQALADRDGVWGLIVEYKINGSWELGDSCWGFIGMDDGGYAPDLMRSTITTLRQAIRNRCRCCKGSGTGKDR